MNPPVDDAALNEVAIRMLADYDAATPGLIFAEGYRLELSDAWRLQTAVTRLREQRGENVIGYKIGAVDPGNQRLLGMPHPAWGRLWDTERHENGVRLRKSNYANLSIEAEFAITLASDLSPGMSVEEIAAAVHAVVPVLELHNLVLRGQQPRGHELLANNAIHCGVVRGAPVTNLDAACPTDLQLVYDGQVVDDWNGLRWPDDFLRAVDWACTSLGEHGLSLKQGDLVLTSAWGPPIPIEHHTRVELRSSAFGNVSATFID